eukprot:2370685-Prymnesium_polylepis.1
MVGGDPREQGREACGDDAEELTTMQRVKRVANVESGIDPIKIRHTLCAPSTSTWAATTRG